MISLDEYVQNMKAEQKDIYHIAAGSVTSAKNTPFLEKLLEKDLEVLFFVDPIDEVAITNLKSYNEKIFVDISKEDLDLGDKNEDKEKEIKQEFGQTCNWIKKRLMKAQTVGDTASLEFMRGRRVFEINSNHGIIRTLDAACRRSPNDVEALRAIDLLYDTALVSSGFTPECPAQLGGKIYEMMTMALSDKWATT